MRGISTRGISPRRSERHVAQQLLQPQAQRRGHLPLLLSSVPFALALSSWAAFSPHEPSVISVN